MLASKKKNSEKVCYKMAEQYRNIDIKGIKLD